jgi:hypothetical protein
MSTVIDSVTDSLKSMNVSPAETAVPTKRKYVYWGVEVDAKTVLEIPEVSDFLAQNPHLVPRERMHTTLLWVGRKSAVDDSHYNSLIGRDCDLLVERFGTSDRALALDVRRVVFADSYKDVPARPAQRQHVTVALADGEKAVDSVLTLVGQGTVYDLQDTVTLRGKLQGYKY